jgi:hypothetical protein
MSYLYSKLPETGVPLLIGTGGPQPRIDARITRRSIQGVERNQRQLVILSPSPRPIVVQVIPFDGAGREGCTSAGTPNCEKSKRLR